jgi:hypothetical protein
MVMIIRSEKPLTRQQISSRLAAPSKIDLEILAVLRDWPSTTGRDICDTLLDTGQLRRRITYTTVKT